MTLPRISNQARHPPSLRLRIPPVLTLVLSWKSKWTEINWFFIRRERERDIISFHLGEDEAFLSGLLVFRLLKKSYDRVRAQNPASSWETHNFWSSDWVTQSWLLGADNMQCKCIVHLQFVVPGTASQMSILDILSDYAGLSLVWCLRDILLSSIGCLSNSTHNKLSVLTQEMESFPALNFLQPLGTVSVCSLTPKWPKRDKMKISPFMCPNFRQRMSEGDCPLSASPTSSHGHIPQSLISFQRPWVRWILQINVGPKSLESKHLGINSLEPQPKLISILVWFFLYVSISFWCNFVNLLCRIFVPF